MCPILGHVWSGGGPGNIVLLVIGASLTFAGLGLRSWRRAPPGTASGLMVLGIALLGLGLVVDANPRPTGSNAVLNIVEPTPLAEVPADRPITVVVEVTTCRSTLTVGSGRTSAPVRG